jgi:hypothetical protein
MTGKKSKSTSKTHNNTRGRDKLPMLLSSVQPELQLSVQALPDGSYRNNNSTAGKCTRCNRGIAHKAVFIKHAGNVYGPECIAYVHKVEEAGVPAADVVRVVQHQFKLRMRDLTTAGMRKKGLIKQQPAPLTSDELELLVSMG